MSDVPFPTLHDVPGLVFRGYMGRNDIPEILALIERMRPADRFDWPVTGQDIIDDFENLADSDPKRDILIAESDGIIAGYSQVWWAKDPNGLLLYCFSVNVDPKYRSTGLGDAMLEWCEAQSRENSKAHDPAVMKLFNLAFPDKMEYFTGLLKKHDYWVYRHGLSMLRPDLDNIPDCQLPYGLEVREVKPEHHEKIRLAWNTACGDMRGQIPIPEDEWNLWSKRSSFDPSLWSIAWQRDEVIGTAFGMIDAEGNALNNRKRGAVEFISTRKDWRGKGVAKALMCRTMRLLKERGMTEAALGVDEENPSGARHLYEKMGFRVTGRATFYRKEF
jgi:ribosomal protein S18 acetylase RimI-like enzyme